MAAITALEPAPAQAVQDELEVIARGRALYRANCLNCHGDQGKGDGPLAELLKVPPTDLTQIKRRNNGRFPEDTVYHLIEGSREVRGHGMREMPIWGNAFRKSDGAMSDDRIYQIVQYLKTIQEERRASLAGPAGIVRKSE